MWPAEVGACVPDKQWRIQDFRKGGAIPSAPFPSLTSLPFSLPLEVGPLNPARGPWGVRFLTPAERIVHWALSLLVEVSGWCRYD